MNRNQQSRYKLPNKPQHLISTSFYCSKRYVVIIIISAYSNRVSSLCIRAAGYISEGQLQMSHIYLYNQCIYLTQYDDDLHVKDRDCYPTTILCTSMRHKISVWQVKYRDSMQLRYVVGESQEDDRVYRSHTSLVDGRNICGSSVLRFASSLFNGKRRCIF